MALRFAFYMVVASMLNVELVSAQASFFNINSKTQQFQITQCADLDVTAGTKVTYIGTNTVTWELYRDNVRIFVKSNPYVGVGNTFDQISVSVPPKAGTYKITATFSVGQSTQFLPIVVLSALTCPSKPIKVVAMLSYRGPNPLEPKPQVITAFENGSIYSSPSGLNLGGGGGGSTTAEYPGPQTVRAMISYPGPDPLAPKPAVITAFEGGGIYSSPNGRDLGGGGGGKTTVVYPGPQRVIAMISYDGPKVKPGVITAFEGGGIYFSPNGLNLGGGGITIMVYPGPQKVRAMISHQGQVFTAFEGGGIYCSPDGRDLGGGGAGKTTVVYPGPQRVIAMLSYPGPNPLMPKPQVITAFEGGGIYSSPNGLDLGGGGGGKTTVVYPGPQRVIAMLSYPGPNPLVPTPGVITAFEGGGIYFSPNGLDLGGGGGGKTLAAYPGPQKVRAMISHQGQVITAFEGAGIYSSPGGLNLGGGSSTVSAYP
jgi:hypothetical protein